MSAALALGERGVGRTGTNPSVGCIIVKDARIIGRGWTQAGGRPHAEAAAIEQAGDEAKDATFYVTLEPCAHESDRGPACADLITAAKPARVVIAARDPDPRTAGKGIERLREAGIEVSTGILENEARSSMAGFFSRIEKDRPLVTLKLATSLDGMIAMTDGSSRWITGEAARAHVHLERARCDAILVGGGTLRADNPTLDVRIPGLENRGPERIALTAGNVPEGWKSVRKPEEIFGLPYNSLFIEGGAETAASFLKAGLVDRLLLYRAPILIGKGLACLGDIGLAELTDAHGRWNLLNSRMFGPDRMELYAGGQAA